MIYRHAAGTAEAIVAEAIQLEMAMRSLLAQLLSGSTTSDRRHELFDASQALTA
ncbi:hypothetical protein IPP75_00035 [Candidatus Saccharibacteria bacterium]|nr:MAG: hypothetical protein IPP75_00035 [Candidatus Saccharibacteria bacterium]